MSQTAAAVSNDNTMTSIWPETWRDDSEFKEMAIYTIGGGLDAPFGNSGYSVIGAGGTITETIETFYVDDADNDADNDDDADETETETAVLFNIQELDSGQEMEIRITPEAARALAKRLMTWAAIADDGKTDLDRTIETLRKEHRRKQSRS